MSDGENPYAKAVEPVVKFLTEQIAELRAQGCSEAELADIETNLERIKQVPESFLPTPEQREMIEFVQRMISRQGTTMPDFDALYKKKADLDRKVFGNE